MLNGHEIELGRPHAGHSPSPFHRIDHGASPPWSAENDPEAPQLRQYLSVLRRRWRLVAGFALGAVVAMLLACLLMQPLYTATAVLHIDDQPAQVTDIQQVVAPPTYFQSVEYFQDQVELLESRSLAATVVQELGLEGNPAFDDRQEEPGLIEATARALRRAFTRARNALVADQPAAHQTGTPAEPVLGVPAELIGRYHEHLVIEPVTNSRMVEIRFTSPSPGLAQSVANAHARAYIHRAIQSKFQLTDEARGFLDTEIERVKQELGWAERALGDFQRRHGVVSVDEEQAVEFARLADLGRRLTEAEADRITAEADYRLIEGREADSLPSIIDNPLIQGLKQEIGRLEVQDAELREVFLPSSPQVKEIASQLARARARLRRETTQAVAGIESRYLAARGREDALRTQLAAQQDDVLDLKELSNQYLALEQGATTARELYATLLKRLHETDVVKGVQLPEASVVDPAERPTLPSHPALALNLAFALVLGAGIGLVLAFLLEHVDPSMKTPDEIRQVLRLPTLGVVPDFALADRERRRTLLPSSRNGNGAAHAVHGDATLPALREVPIEAYRSIRTSILFFNAENPPRTLLVTSSQPQEGKTSTAVHLARSLAQLGQRVVIIDADMRAPRVHRILGVPPGPGLCEVLTSAYPLQDAILDVPCGSTPGSSAVLRVLRAGTTPSDPAALLASTGFDDLMTALGQHYDLVLIDSPPVFPISDSTVLARRVDGVVLVVRGNRTDRAVIREAVARLHFMRANVMGVVLNGVDPTSSHYHGYAYYFAA